MNKELQCDSSVSTRMEAAISKSGMQEETLQRLVCSMGDLLVHLRGEIPCALAEDKPKQPYYGVLDTLERSQQNKDSLISKLDEQLFELRSLL